MRENMQKKEVNVTYKGLGFMQALFLVLLVLKLTGVIDWSWWLITLPLWGPLAIILLALIGVGILALVACIMEKVFK